MLFALMKNRANITNCWAPSHPLERAKHILHRFHFEMGVLTWAPGCSSGDYDHVEDDAYSNMNSYFKSEFRDCLSQYDMPMALKTCLGYICNDGFKFQMERRKISRRRPRFVDEAELSHFMLLFCRGPQRNVQRFIKHVHSYCFDH